MHISSYYKGRGDHVVLKTDYNGIEDFDLVMISKVFEDTPVPFGVLDLKNVQYGGTGFFFDKAPPLPYEVEHAFPDYHLYDDWISQMVKNGANEKEFDEYTNYSIGRFTIGCIRRCSFCVNKDKTRVEWHSNLDEFLDPSRKFIALLDDNIFAYAGWRDVFNILKASGKSFKFKNGIDERLLTDEKCDILFSAKHQGEITFAFDNIADQAIIVDKLRMIRRHTTKIIRFYVLCGYDHAIPQKYDDDFFANDIRDTFERIKILMQYDCLPYIMRHKDYENSPYRGTYINFARWCNQPSFLKKKSYRQFCEANGVESACYKYMLDFEKDHVDIASKYYDIRWRECK